MEVDSEGRLREVFSRTSVTAFISWVLADVITADRGIPFLSVKMCLFVPSLLLSAEDYFLSCPP